MKGTILSFGSITIEGITYEKDVIIDNGKVRKRNKSKSKKFSEKFGHTPLSAEEDIPWKCRRLIVGAGHSSTMPVMDEVFELAFQRGVELIVMSTPEAVKHLDETDTNLILHLTC